MLSAKNLHNFWSKVSRAGDDECWDWIGAINSRGYGSIKIKGLKASTAHRVSYIIHSGEDIPDGMWVLHSCDRRCCVNPRHLRLGTHRDNMNDMKERGRWRWGGVIGDHHGIHNGRAKLTDEQIPEVRRLRSEGWKLRELSSKFGVCMSMISMICRGVNWKHVA